MFDARAATAPTAKPARGPSATPVAATMTVTGWTPGTGAKSTRPAAARPASVAMSVRSFAEPGDPSTQAKPATITARAARRTEKPPRDGSSAAHAAAPSATAAATPTVADALADTDRLHCCPSEPDAPVGRKRPVVGGDEHTASARRIARDPVR